MPDVHTSEQRRRNMASIRSKNTKPEKSLRRLLLAEGYRYRVNVAGLPGKPDIVFPGRRKAIFVNGCFWHLHTCRFGQVHPATNPDFWRAKREATASRDARKQLELENLGWQVFTVWECELREPSAVLRRTTAFLES